MPPTGCSRAAPATATQAPQASDTGFTVAGDRDDVLPFVRLHARLGQRRAELRIPIQSAVDFGEAIAAVLDFVIRAEETARNRLDLGQ